MIDFPIHNDCQACPLYEASENPGLPTERLRFDGEECDFEVRKDKALLFVGQGPGAKDDRNGRSWIGYAGGLLQRFVNLSGMRQYADIYVTNATRCRPPQGSVPTDGQVGICRQYLDKDIELLRKHYKEVILVGCGAKAAKSIGRHRSLGGAVRRQGVAGVWPDCSCFYTNNPAILSPSRSPSLVQSVEDHFRLIIRYLRGEYLPNDLSIEPLVGVSPPNMIKGDLVTFDIETYGILAGKDQSVFHPEKSLLVDGVPYHEQVITCAFGWRGPDNILKTALYRMDYPWHHHLIIDWFKWAANKGLTVVGQTTKFDIQYIRKAIPALSYWVNPNRLKLDDTMLVSFLEFEQRPERGLKELALLLGITDYGKSGVTGKEGNAQGYGDPALHHYNCLDAAVTLILYEEMLMRIKCKYHDHSAKNSPRCKEMRNMVVWDVIELEKNGSCLDIEQLKDVHEIYEVRKALAMETSAEQYGLKLCGTGSDKPLREFFTRVAEENGLIGSEALEWTKKSGKISIGVANSNLFLQYLGDGDDRKVLELYQEYKNCAKITSTYTSSLLGGGRKGIVRKEKGLGIVYPSWYPIPSFSSKGAAGDDKGMGQIQGRFSVSAPARHTEPKLIRNCSCSRFPGGTLAEYDMSQDHLRMAALLSNDPVLYSAYTTPGESLHTMTACDIFEDADPSIPGWKDTKEYHLGKTLNFLVLFRGGPAAYVRTARKDTGYEITMDFAERAIRTWYDIHPVFKQWQNSLIEEAARKGYIETLTGWSRTFGGGAKGVAAAINEVCNCAIQCLCAQCTQSAQFEIGKELLSKRMKSLLSLQIHDSIFVDQYPGEEDEVDEIVKRHMERPPVLVWLEQQLLRTIPFVCEKKVYQDGR